MAENPEDGILYAVGFTAPKFPGRDPLPPPINEKPKIFTTPILAVFPVDAQDSVEATKIFSHDLPLALPLSIVWTGVDEAGDKCGGADLNGDGEVDLRDVAVFAFRWLDPNCASLDWCGGSDLDESGVVNLKDLAIIAQHWLETECGL